MCVCHRIRFAIIYAFLPVCGYRRRSCSVKETLILWFGESSQHWCILLSLASAIHNKAVTVILKLCGAFVLGGVVRTSAVGVALREIQSLLPLRSPPGTRCCAYPSSSRGRSSGSNGWPGAVAWGRIRVSDTPSRLFNGANMNGSRDVYFFYSLNYWTWNL